MSPRALAAWPSWMCCLFAAALFSSPARAQSTDEGDCFERRQSDACLRVGTARQQAKDAAGAQEAYRIAWSAEKSHKSAAQLGKVELELGDYAAAYTHLKYALETLPADARGTPGESELADEAAQALAKVAGRRLLVEPPDSKVTIDGEPVEAELLGHWLGLPPGERVLVVARQGFETVEQTLDLEAGSEAPLSIVLRPSDSSRDDDSSGDRDTTESSNGPDFTMPLIVAGSVVGAAAIGVGVGLHVVADGKSEELEAVNAQLSDPNVCSGTPSGDDVARCQLAGDLSDQEATFSKARTGLLISGAVVGAATVTFAIVVIAVLGDDDEEDEDEEDDTGLLLLPTIGPEATGLTLSGSF